MEKVILDIPELAPAKKAQSIENTRDKASAALSIAIVLAVFLFSLVPVLVILLTSVDAGNFFSKAMYRAYMLTDQRLLFFGTLPIIASFVIMRNFGKNFSKRVFYINLAVLCVSVVLLLILFFLMEPEYSYVLYQLTEGAVSGEKFIGVARRAIGTQFAWAIATMGAMLGYKPTEEAAKIVSTFRSYWNSGKQ